MRRALKRHMQTVGRSHRASAFSFDYAHIAELERIKADGVSDKAEADIDALIERFKAALED